MDPKKVVIFAVALIFAVECLDNPIVETSFGPVRGYFRYSYEGRMFSVFEGIPYAAPPVGSLKLKAPQAADPWDGIFEANLPTTCLQIDMDSGSGLLGTEDCLTINIYTPSETPSSQDNFDVVVHIHGGGFVMGSGLAGQPTIVIDRNFLFVTFNYRLGPLGFLCTNDAAVPCNLGLKDQSFALRWIQENIKSFGGNPNSVTITGQSAGGASVHYHYLSPLSKGLFHRGFSMSGSALDPWAFQRQPLQNVMRMAADVGCDDVSSTLAIIGCFKTIPSDALVRSAWNLYDFVLYPIAPLGPTVEPEGEDVFLPDHPYNLLKRGEINDVPWLTSATTDEGINFIFATKLYEDLDDFNENWSAAIHLILDTNTTVADENKEYVAEQIKQFYFGDESVTPEVYDALSKLITDREFVGGFQRASLVQANVSSSPIYSFMMAYVGEEYSFTDNYKGVTDMIGVCHGDDIQFIFGSPSQFTENDNAMRLVYLDMLESFIENDQPNVNDLNWFPVSDPEILSYLHIQSPYDISFRRSKDLANVEFWDSLPIREYENEE